MAIGKKFNIRDRLVDTSGETKLYLSHKCKDVWKDMLTMPERAVFCDNLPSADGVPEDTGKVLEMG